MGNLKKGNPKKPESLKLVIFKKKSASNDHYEYLTVNDDSSSKRASMTIQFSSN